MLELERQEDAEHAGHAVAPAHHQRPRRQQQVVVLDRLAQTLREDKRGAGVSQLWEREPDLADKVACLLVDLWPLTMMWYVYYEP